MTSRAPRVYFSFRSPFSWMAVRRLCEAVPDAMTRLEFRPYWDPDPQTEAALTERGAEFHYVQMSRAKHRYILLDTKRLAARAGLRMVWPIDVDPWWELPHLAWLKARRLGRAEQFYAAATDARWEHGRDICEPVTLREVARAAGLDGDELAGAVHDPAIRAEGVDCLVAAYHDDVFGIPYCIAGRDRFWGLDRLDDFVAALHAHPSPEPERDAGRPAPAGAAYDTDTAGGCG
ncbi:DsbA family protein [Dactylosporangium sp. NPDC000244]|uniref:2-hydroxychromene-2-carboxylate isomerase n=1 Tax=Dactylosporangium sp. NPDC000244 TaxID=3154365 RepID=UPI003334429F